MKTTTSQDLVRKTIIWLLAIVIVLYLVSGFGITEFRTVETLTFGLLTKNLAFKIHNILWIPFAILLILHLCLPFIFKWVKGRRRVNR
jgi:cytochrome b subunit of formate dehydrogenase